MKQNAFDFIRGLKLAIQGQDSVANNNRVWFEWACSAIERLESGATVDSDWLRRHCEIHDYQPGHSNAIGSVFISLLKKNAIVRVGQKKSTFTSNHAREIKVYKVV